MRELQGLENAMAGLLAKRVAIVTGASAGIGWATSEALAREGAAVVVSARRGEKLRELVQSIEKMGGKAIAVAADASKPEDIEQLMAKADAYAQSVGGKLNIFTVNAGRGLAGGLLSSDEAKWKEMYELNVLGAAALMRRAGQYLVDRAGEGQKPGSVHGGDILVLGSVSGHNISPFSGFYGSTKFAIAGMAEAFRREVCGKGIRVTCIMPGIVVSEFQEVAGYTPENFFKGVERYGKLLEPGNVAETIRFIVSQPPHVHVNELVIRPTGQDYP
jgi:NADP-dependent 3-hydroxy acid dehydrogenase YdfG